MKNISTETFNTLIRALPVILDNVNYDADNLRLVNAVRMIRIIIRKFAKMK